MDMHIEKDYKKMLSLIAQFPDQADDWLRGVAIQMMNEIILSFNSSPDGRTYELYKPRRMHTASQPGNPPNVDIGALRGSITFKRNGALDYTIQDGVEYGVYLEYGTNKMAPRPFVAPVFEQWRNKIASDFMQNAGLK